MALQQINWLQINTKNIPSGSQVILASESNPLEWVYTKNLFTSGGFIVSGSLDTSGDVVIGGNLTVKGATTIIESNIVSIGDNIIELNGTLGSYGGLIVKDQTQPNTVSGSLLWDTVNDKWIGGPLGSEEGFIQETEFNNYTSSLNVKTTDNVVATTAVGAINAGDSVDAGTTLQGFVEKLLNKIYYPTYTPHSFSLTNNAGNKPKEVGSSFDITLTFNFDQGQILGAWVGNIWEETEPQADKLGPAISYSFNGVSQSGNTKIMTVTTELGTNKFEGTVTYGEGAQPKDSKGYNFESPDGGGISPIQRTSFEGIYPYFYYKSTSQITPESMKNAIANGQATKVVASSTGTITIPFKADGEYIAVAYPATSTTKKAWYVTEVDKGKIELGGGVFGLETTLLCSDSSTTKLWEDVYYKIHVSPGLITQDKDIQLRNQFI